MALQVEATRDRPVCDKVFQGGGWDGIDAHWRSRHERQGTAYRRLRPPPVSPPKRQSHPGGWFLALHMGHWALVRRPLR